MADGSRPLLQLRGITKRYGAVTALDRVEFEVNEREILGLIGDNGAGKSTLIKVISGAHVPEEGEYWFDGAKAHVKSPEDARRLGIETVYQDLALFEHSTVAENIFAGRELLYKIPFLQIVNRAEMRRRSNEILTQLKIHIRSADALVKHLSGGQRQSVAIGRAIAFGKRLVLLDEPTAALGAVEQQKVLDLVKRLKENGYSVVMISHNLDHVFSTCDRLFILHQGRRVFAGPVSSVTKEQAVRMMMGGTPPAVAV